ncbi:SMP-30/gluconolactonase/LRE family protein [uncultured Devosia sp.]|uniref:SMP-30/gluconolactonase/LRE family protein n=1 Tax=uncultured Devosia sp. TaxID=211434 RepID=UPI0035C96D9D
MNQTAELLIDSQCALGEGPFWHPLRQQVFFFDINNRKLFAAEADGAVAQIWSFDEIVAAAAVIDADNLAIATETGLKRYNLLTGAVSLIVPIEADNGLTRTNDSRVHPSGAFWIGTMRKDEDAAEGTVYHYRAGKLSVIRRAAKVPNATCFSPDGRIAYWTDTPTKQILQCPTDPATGMPIGEWSLFADVADGRGFPDGAVVDSEGYLWNAKWGGNCVVRHAPDGTVDRIIEVPVSQVSCPAFGGPELKTLFLTTANKTLSAEQLAEEKVAGGVFAIALDIAGQPEPLITL